MRHHLVLARSSLAVGLWIGMLGGGVELGVAAYRRWMLHRLLFVGGDYWWLTPLLAGAIAGGATVLATAMVPRRLATSVQRVRLVVPLILASLGVLLMFRGLAPRRRSSSPSVSARAPVAGWRCGLAASIESSGAPCP